MLAVLYKETNGSSRKRFLHLQTSLTTTHNVRVQQF